MKTPFHIMIIPTLGCPSNCKYCWSSEEGSPVMEISTIRAIVKWLNVFRSDPITITFHGGEPLLAGVDFYRQALPILVDGLKKNTPSFAMQTNLWRLTPELADILAKYHIPIGSSIDGPMKITDYQRGEGYFNKTMQGFEIARSHGLNVRFICTFTSYSFDMRDEILHFFIDNGFTLKLHPALPSLRSKDPEEWALAPEKYGDLLMYLLDESLSHLEEIDIMNINDLVRSVFTRRGNVCTFADCMGNTYAIGPDGSIYPCYRFVGMPDYIMGNVSDCPGKGDLDTSPAGELMSAYRRYVDDFCSKCTHIRYCRGGCPYNAIAPSNGKIAGVDPHCLAYMRIFDEISKRLNSEMFESNEMMPPFSSGNNKRSGKPGIMSLMHKIASQ
jgi:uncharacterized protein